MHDVWKEEVWTTTGRSCFFLTYVHLILLRYEFELANLVLIWYLWAEICVCLCSMFT